MLLLLLLLLLLLMMLMILIIRILMTSCRYGVMTKGAMMTTRNS